MLNCISTTTVILTGVLIIFILIYYQPFKNSKNLSNSNNSKELSDCSNELNKLRRERNGVEKNLHSIEQRFSLLNLLSLSIRAIFSPLKLLSPSFILYTFILYIFHTCISNRLASQTIKLLYIVNIISYLLISIFYTSLKHFEYSNLAWLLFIFLFIRLFIR
ncbi:unnamed protein product [Rotaria magnacalcarata]|uniref:Uncharacterized protein n=1 Tax=Rotaria magnacalcarata TaxID=392030 RepID=A0A816WD13_9BILA|nr:unnamed protein product [Rotaria magnacalcarata]CAF1291812.1 unnamed protein product [Rotaria magnacalcarata]CAF2131239.1 unnamed protein product [Rotaria magnacalcarata]CAF2132358.1 unnamed protein product [Rotaria magnacalcarata]